MIIYLSDSEPTGVVHILRASAEEGFKTIGRTDEGRHVLIVFTLRTHEGRTFIRPISARFKHAKEIKYYEETGSNIADR